MDNYFYFDIDEKEHSVHTAEVSFNTFMRHIPNKPRNVLLLSGTFWKSHLAKNLHLFYVKNKDIPSFAEDNVYANGDFCWTDFNDESDLNIVTKRELKELFYNAHMLNIYKEPFFKSIDNDYFYIAHDDYIYTKIYMRSIYDYRYVISGKIQDELNERNIAHTPLTDDLISALYDFARDMLLVDLKSMRTSKKIIEIDIFHPCEKIHDASILYHESNNFISNAKEKKSLRHFDGEWSIL